MFDINKLVRDNVRNLTPYSCARDEFKGDTGVFLDANENPYGNLNRYPDPYQKELKNAISKIKDVTADKIFLGNGSDEIIDLCYRVFCTPGTEKALTFSPTYGMYEVSAGVNDVELIKIPLDAEFQIDINSAEKYFNNEKLKLIFICSPNNPTGNCFRDSDIEYIIKKSGAIVVIDEAYNDFSNKKSFRGMIDKFPNLIVMQTFSKALGLASVRIGMAFTNPSIIGYLNKIKPPYNISSVNQKAALRKLANSTLYKNQVSSIKKEKIRLTANLEKLDVVQKVYPSDANFILIKVTDATSIYNLLVNGQIIVRNRTSVVNNCLRVTVGTRKENSTLIKALKQIKI